MPSGERRKHPRLPLRQTRAHHRKWDGVVLDLSLGGMAVETTCGLDIGSHHRLGLTRGSRRVQIEGVIRWCRLARTVRLADRDVMAVYRAGLMFPCSDSLAAVFDGSDSAEWCDPLLFGSR